MKNSSDTNLKIQLLAANKIYKMAASSYLFKDAGRSIQFSDEEEAIMHQMVTVMIRDFIYAVETYVNKAIAELSRKNKHIPEHFIRKQVEETNIGTLFPKDHVFSTQECVVSKVDGKQIPITVRLLHSEGPEEIEHFHDFLGNMAGGSGNPFVRKPDMETYKDRYGYRIGDERFGEIVLHMNGSLKYKDIQKKEKEIIMANINTFMHEMSHSKDIVTNTESIRQMSVNFGSATGYPLYSFILKRPFNRKCVEHLLELQRRYYMLSTIGQRPTQEMVIREFRQLEKEYDKKLTNNDLGLLLTLLGNVHPNEIFNALETSKSKESRQAVGIVQTIIEKYKKQGKSEEEINELASREVYSNYINSPSEVKARQKQVEYVLTKLYNINKLRAEFAAAPNKLSYLNALLDLVGGKYLKDPVHNVYLINEKNKRMIINSIYKIMTEPIKTV